ncbi:hypothetical protein HYH03_011783 [Edaphochlamys debaryana]|uniref:Pseudouridine synthase RsuA/RluA-like domain-containing protein n=1 Tax=Edaphochlamys debaryana TaxID=47281 RepID=A0A836BW21_9CHLO|nr:hypothetical protein HYH03_011783 [Edaphochlamys debaryana]|eukprot:KAG2489673.1 hypothetical protein HYH03_011783 [Edaphochlamys debaryana]
MEEDAIPSAAAPEAQPGAPPGEHGHSSAAPPPTTATEAPDIGVSGGTGAAGKGAKGGKQPGTKGRKAQAQSFVPPDLPPGSAIEDASSAPQLQDYMFVRGLRLVRPYFFDFKCFVKARQDGKSLQQLMADDFPMLGPDYYAAAVATGRLRVEGPGSGGGGGSNRPLRSGMCVRHFVHRHEPPVAAGEVEILGITPHFVAVNKPPSMPVHTVGQYRKNTVMGVVQATYPHLWPLHPTYRLDKPVSGVLLLARSGAVAGRMRALLEERGCSKAYVARVQGVFPDTAALPGGYLAVDVPLTWEPSTNHAAPAPRPDQPPWPPGAAGAAGLAALAAAGPGAAGGGEGGGGEVEAEAAGAGAGAEGGGPAAKHAETHFRRLSVSPDGLTSVVEALPKTGRTHQIRVHLQYLGHPIANDTQYGGTYGLPLFFRRGMGGPARPHVNGQRRQHAAEKAPDGDTAMAAADAGDSESQAAAKRQRRCDDAGADGAEAEADTDQGVPAAAVSADGAGASGSGGEVVGCTTAATVAAVGTAGPNGDAELIAASSERYMSLYTDPEFQVPGGGGDPLCPHCPCLVPEGYPIDLEPLYLHAARYSAGGEPAAAGNSEATVASSIGGEDGVVDGGAGAEEGEGAGGVELTGNAKRKARARAKAKAAGQDGADDGLGSWSFEAPLPDWAAPDFVAVPAGRGAGVAAG